MFLGVKSRARGTIRRMTFPAAVPEIPVANVDKAAGYYVNKLGFTFDWGDDQGGIAGISTGNCRLFITNRSFRESYGNIGPILFWLNLDSKAEVDELFARWKASHRTRGQTVEAPRVYRLRSGWQPDSCLL